MEWARYEQFSDSSAIKIANIANFNKEVEIIKPENFMDYTYNFACHVNKPGYIEYIFETILKFLAAVADIKCWAIQQADF